MKKIKMEKSYELRVEMQGAGKRMSHKTTKRCVINMVKVAYRSVKTRRKSLVSNKVFLQMAGRGYFTAEAQRWRSHTIKSAYGTAEKKGKTKNSILEKAKTTKRNLYIKWLRHLLWHSGRMWMEFGVMILACFYVPTGINFLQSSGWEVRHG